MLVFTDPVSDEAEDGSDANSQADTYLLPLTNLMIDFQVPEFLT